MASIRLITNVGGTEVRRTTYTPYGHRAVVTGTHQEPEGYIGERHDAETGLLYLHARYYDPLIARFISPDWWDPHEAGVGTNRYAYAFNDPINLSDTNGHIAVDPGIPGDYFGYGNPNEKAAETPAKSDKPAEAPETNKPKEQTNTPPKSEARTPTPTPVAEVPRSRSDMLPNGKLPADAGGGGGGTGWGWGGGGRGGSPPAASPPNAPPKAAMPPSRIDRGAFDKTRSDFWKDEGKKNPGGYSPSDLDRMKQGKAPIGKDGHPMELHHKNGDPKGPIEPMTRTDHRLGPNYRENHPHLFGD